MSADLNNLALFAFGASLLGIWVVVGYGVGLSEARWRSAQSSWWRSNVVYGLPWGERALPALPGWGLGFMFLPLGYALGGRLETFASFPLDVGQDVGLLGFVFLFVGVLCFVFCPRWAEPAWHRDARLGIAVPPFRPKEFRLTPGLALYVGVTLLGAIVATPVLGFGYALGAAFIVVTALGFGFRLLQRLRG